MTKRLRFAVVASHVIQYYGPMFRLLAQHPKIDLRVLFCSRDGAESYYDHQFGVRLKWDVPLLEGYDHQFLTNLAPTQQGFFRRVNPGLVLALLRYRPDGVWVSGWGTLSMWLAYVACWVMRIPYFVYGDTAFVMERPGVRGWIRRTVLRALFARAGGFLLQGAMNGDVYAYYGADRRRFFLVPYAVDNERFHAESRMTTEERSAARAEYGIPPHHVVILFSGKLLPGKNPIHLLYAMERMRNRNRVAVVFMGDGSERDRLLTYAKDRELDHVYLVGFRNQTEMPRIYGLADIFVLPSSLDMRGTVCNEAMACELPVIITNMVGIYGEGDILRAGENGFIYDVGDIDTLAQRLDDLVEDPTVRQKMGKRGWQIIRGWSFERDVEGIVQALEHVTRAPRDLQPIPAESTSQP
jgi:glycosyltransferase involved in cell wall biosynthesis